MKIFLLIIPTKMNFWEKVSILKRAAIEKKANDLVLLNLKGAGFVTDYFLICSGRSDRQVQTIAMHIEEEMEKAGNKALGKEGFREGNWILIDYGEIWVHVFYQPTREFYDLEGLWSEVPRIPIEEIAN